MHNISAHLNSLNADVHAFRQTYQYIEEHERWTCVICKESSSSEIKVKGFGHTLDEAVSNAYAKFCSLIQAPQVCQALDLPLLTQS